MWVSGEASVVEEENHVAPFQSSLDLLSEPHGLGRSIDFLGDRGLEPIDSLCVGGDLATVRQVA